MSEAKYIPPYEGNDMAGYIMGVGFKLMNECGSIRSITNIHDTAIIVCDYGIWRARPHDHIGFCIERLNVF